MYIVFLIVFLLISIALITIVMLQQGKSGDMGTSLGAGAAATLFGSSGSGGFMTKITVIFAVLFFIISLILGNLTTNKSITKIKLENVDKLIEVKKSIKEPISPHVTSTKDVPN